MKRIDVQINGKLVGQCESAGKASSPLFKDIIDPWIEIEGFVPASPSLTDDQQVVLDYLKKMCPPKLGVSAIVTVYCLVDDNINDNWQEYSEEIPEHIEALQKLTIAEENQILKLFSQWALEQEETE